MTKLDSVFVIYLRFTGTIVFTQIRYSILLVSNNFTEVILVLNRFFYFCYRLRMNMFKNPFIETCRYFKGHLFSFLFLSALFLSISKARSQESLSISGGDAIGSGGTVSYSLGQVSFTTISSGLASVSQGVQQAYEIYSLGLNDTELQITLNVFPNPTSKNLSLQISDYNNERFSYEIHDLNNKIINNGQITSATTQMNTEILPAGLYFLTLYNFENKKVESFEIIKN